MLINVDNTAFEKSIAIFRDLREKYSVPENLIQGYLNSPGIIFLRKHLKHHGGLELDEMFLIRLLNKTLENPNVAYDDNMLLRSIKRGYKLLEVTEQEFKKVNTNELVHRAIDLANLNLPKAIDEDIKIYFLYGIRGTGIVLENEIAIDICDEYVNKNGIINSNNLVGILAHELHHIAIKKHLFIKQRSEENKNIQRLIAFLGDLVSEGLAYYYLPTPYESNEMINEKWNVNLKNINVILSQINNYIDEIIDGSLVDLNEISYLFDDNLIGYTAGYTIIKAIDQAFGKAEVFEYIDDCFLFIKKYKQAIEISTEVIR